MYGHDYVGPEHILLGLIQEGEGVAAEILEWLSVDLAVVRKQINSSIRDGQHESSGGISYTPQAEALLQETLRDAVELGHNYVSTDHILLGLIREAYSEDSGPAMQVLVTAGADFDRVQQHVRELYPSCLGSDAIRSKPDLCAICGGSVGFMRRFSAYRELCATCNRAAGNTLSEFKRIAPILIRDDEGVASGKWQLLMMRLMDDNISIPYALSLICNDSQAYVDDLLSTLIKRGGVTQEEVDFADWVAGYLQVRGPNSETWNNRIDRALLRSDIANGVLPPTIIPNGIQHGPTETFYMDVPAQYRLVRKSGNEIVHGRVLVSDTKFRFIGERSRRQLDTWGPIAGWELALGKILKVDTYPNGIDIVAMQKKGSGFYFVDDGGVTSETIQLLIKIANRQIDLQVTSRDTRRIPQEVKNAVYKRDGGRCQACHSKSYLEFDHIIPLSKGGASTVNNLQLLCRRCNMKKGPRL